MATQPIHPVASSRTYAAVALTTAADGVSEALNITGFTLSAIRMSTAWTDAAIGFQASVNGVTYYDVYDTAGNFLTYQTSANRIVVFDPFILSGLQYIKVVSETTAGVAVPQAAARVISFFLNDLT